MNAIVDKHNRRSIRLKEYDYKQAGYYFVTVCVNDRKLLLGEIKNDCRGTACCALDKYCAHNKYGQIVYNEWINTGKFRKNVELDEFIVMPNHFHGIVIINEQGTTSGVTCQQLGTARQQLGTARRAPTEGFGKPVAGSLSTIMRSFKSAVTKRINETRNMPGAQFWQRNYYEHVIRDDNDLIRIREYIVNNFAQWENDDYYVK